MVEYRNTSCEKEIHRFDSLSNEDSKNINFFYQRGLNFGEGWLENSGKMPNNREIYCYAN